MRSYKLAFSAAALFCTLVIGGQANAAPIEYEFSGTFDGSLNGSALTGQSFTVDLFGDTSNVTFSGGEYANIASSATFTIGASAGSLTGTFNDVVLNPSFSSGTVIFGQAQSSSPFFVGEGVSSSPLSSYNLQTALALTSGGISQTAGSTYFTTDGNLVFGNISSLSFQAKLLPTPLPATFPLFATALAAMGLLGWLRKRKA